MTEQEQQTFGLTKREFRENELMGMLGSPAGRNQLTELLRRCLNIPSGQIPLGTPFVQTILSHEFANQEGSTSA
jgi:hypothetical protein